MEFLQGEWISCVDAGRENVYMNFRQTFITEEDKPLSMKISADSRYAVYLNGQYIAAGQYADYPQYKVADELDIPANAVKTGENELEVQVFCQGRDSSNYRAGEPGVIYEICRDKDVIAASGSKTMARINAKYQNGEIENVSGQLGFTFRYDATRSETEWQYACTGEKRKYHDRETPLLREEERLPGRILAQGVFSGADEKKAIGAKMQYASMAFREFAGMTGMSAPVDLPSAQGVPFQADGGDGIYFIVDLFREDAGYIDLDIEVQQDTRIIIGWGEHIDDLRARTFRDGRNFAAGCTVAAGRTNFIHRFRRAGMRYIQLFVFARQCRVYYAGIVPVHYPFREESRMMLADRLDQRIYEVSKNTLLHCLHEHYEDCPWREQALYTMDSRNQMLFGYYAFGEYRAPKASMRLMALSLREDGMLELCSPAKVSITIPSFSAMFLTQLDEYLLFSGDTVFAEEMLPVAQRIADAFLEKRGAHGLIPAYTDREYWNFYEWSDYLEGYMKVPGEGERYDAPLQAFVAMGLTHLAHTLQVLGKTQESARCEQAVREMTAGVNEVFFDEGKGIYRSFKTGETYFGEDEMTQAVVCAASMCPEEKLDGVLERLTDGTLSRMTLSHRIFRYDALMLRREKYEKYILDEVADVFGKMLFGGATTFWETEKGAWDFTNAGSLCHGWSAVPIYVYARLGFGVYPKTPGFSEYTREQSAHFRGSMRVERADGTVFEVENK